MEMELRGVLVADPNTKYSYRAAIENLINYNKLIADTRLLAERWKNDSATHSEVTNPAGANTIVISKNCMVCKKPCSVPH